MSQVEAYVPLSVTLLGCGLERSKRIVCTLPRGVTISANGRTDDATCSMKCLHTGACMEYDAGSTSSSLSCGRYLLPVLAVLRDHRYHVPNHHVVITSDVGCLTGMNRSVAVMTAYVRYLKEQFGELLEPVNVVWAVGQAHCRMGRPWPTGVRAASQDKQASVYAENNAELHRLVTWPADWELLLYQLNPPPSQPQTCPWVTDVAKAVARESSASGCVGQDRVDVVSAAIGRNDLLALRHIMLADHVDRLMAGTSAEETVRRATLCFMEYPGTVGFGLSDLSLGGAFIAIIAKPEHKPLVSYIQERLGDKGRFHSLIA